MTHAPDSVSATAKKIVSGDRVALAQAVTRAESMLPADREATDALLAELRPNTGHSKRVGITGIPGVGKSSFIENLGMRLVDSGKHRVAVLAVDPSSARTGGGSILGDKTRMPGLSRSDRAFVRPSPGGSNLDETAIVSGHGGVALRTREVMLLVEAAGYDVVIVETIGAGQAETAVAGMVDLFTLLLLAGTGDELQGIKRGVMELAEVVVLHKADGDRHEPTLQAAVSTREALRLLHGHDELAAAPQVIAASSFTGAGVDEYWDAVLDELRTRDDDGRMEARRTQQALAWFDAAWRVAAVEQLLSDPKLLASRNTARNEVATGRSLPSAAARAAIAPKS